jgi:parallel beta-helix repeat protein
MKLETMRRKKTYWHLVASLILYAFSSAPTMAVFGAELRQDPVPPVFADDDNTGVAKGVNLKRSSGLTIRQEGAIIEDMDIDGMVSILAPNVTLRNVRISAEGWAALDIRASDVTVENCEIDGKNGPGIRGISINASRVNIRHCNIHNVEDGIYIGESSKISIENNYIHELRSNWDGPHFDGIATDGNVSDIEIRNNNVINDNNQTSAIMISNYFGDAIRINIIENRLSGGGYTIYVDGQFNNGIIHSVFIDSNILKKGHFGFNSIVNNHPIWQNNVDYITGNEIRE